MSPVVSLLANLFVLATAITTVVLASVLITGNSLPGITGNVTGERFVAMTGSGVLYEAAYGPSDLQLSQPEEVTKVSVLSSGAGVINFTIDLTRRGLYRSWSVASDVGTLNATETLVVDLNGTGVLLPSDMPLLNDVHPFHISEMGIEWNATVWYHGAVRIDGEAQRLTISPPYVFSGGATKQNWHQLEGQPFSGIFLAAPVAFRDTFSWYVPPSPVP